MPGPILWGGGNVANNLENQIANADGSVLRDTGSYNYIRNSDFEQSISSPSGPTLFTTTLTGQVPTGTITNGAASLGLTQDTTTPLVGTGSLSATAVTAWTFGQGFYLPTITVQRAHLGKVLTFGFYYNALFGASTANWSGQVGSQTLQVWIYDTTNAVWIQPTGCFGMNQSSGTGYVTGTFQSSVTVGQQYQLCVLAASNTSGQITVDFDQFYLGPQTVPVGYAGTDLKSYTLTIGAVTTPPTLGTTTVNLAQWSRLGDKALITYQLKMTGAGTAGSGTYLFPLPPGLSIDSAKQNFYDGARGLGTVVGSSGVTNTGAGDIVSYPIAYNSTNIALYDETHGSFIGSGNYALSAATIYYSFEVIVPIAGWSSNVQISNDTDTRVIAAQAYCSTNSASSATVPINFDTTVDDFTSAITPSATAWKFTAAISGFYSVTGSIGAAATATAIQLYKNGVAYKTLGSADPAAAVAQAFAGIVRLNAGDYIDVRPNTSLTVTGGSMGTAGVSTISVFRLSGPSVIAASESVNASYFVSANFAASATVPINFDSKEFDSHAAVTPSASAWKFTAPASGTFQISMTGGSNAAATVSIYKNGSAYKAIGNTNGANQGGYNASLIRLVAGDFIDLRPSAAATFFGGTLSTSQGTNISIARVGN